MKNETTQELLPPTPKMEVVQTLPTMTEISPMSLLQMAIDKNAPIDSVSKLMDLQERWEKNQAKKAYEEAMTEFKKNPPEIGKDKSVGYKTKEGDFVGYKHATLDKASKIIGLALSKVGISHRWDVEQADSVIKVSCVLTHKLGHSERVTLSGPADNSGKKNAIQSIGSTVTYLQRYTLFSAVGIAAKGQDDDGQAAEQPEAKEGLSKTVFEDHISAMKTATTENELLQAWLKAQSVAKRARDDNALDGFKKTVNAMRKKLGLI